MSKIVFWSPLHGQGQTSNLHITAVIMSLLYKKRILMMQTHFTMNNMEGPLVGKNLGISNTESNHIFQDIGLDAAVMYSQMDMLNESILESCCMTFPDTSLLLLPGTKIKNRETFDRDICKSVCKMIQQAEDYVDIVMIDSNSGSNDLSYQLITSADLIIVNLTQSRYVLDKFFLEYGKWFNDFGNVFFLFGSYNKNSGYNIHNCRRKYGKYINKNNSGVIPYCTKYMDAQNECDILGMVKKGLYMNQLKDIYKGKELLIGKLRLGSYYADETDYFFYQSCRSVAKIKDMLSVNERKSLIKRSGA